MNDPMHHVPWPVWATVTLLVAIIGAGALVFSREQIKRGDDASPLPWVKAEEEPGRHQEWSAALADLEREKANGKASAAIISNLKTANDEAKKRIQQLEQELNSETSARRAAEMNAAAYKRSADDLSAEAARRKLRMQSNYVAGRVYQLQAPDGSGRVATLVWDSTHIDVLPSALSKEWKEHPPSQ